MFEGEKARQALYFVLIIDSRCGSHDLTVWVFVLMSSQVMLEDNSISMILAANTKGHDLEDGDCGV